MKTIWKYQIHLGKGNGKFDIPKGGKIVHVACPQHLILNFWVEVETTNNILELRHFTVLGTGHPIPDGAKYVGTAVDTNFVWHLYES